MTDDDSLPNTKADKFVMLFSADWFRPYWYVTGFKADAESRDLFQQEMRSQVKALMGDADQYWHLSFKNQRRGNEAGVPRQLAEARGS